MAPILSVRNLSTGYGKKQVLFDVSLDVMPGEILLITGGNGSGKSTLLKAIYGLLRPWNSNAEIIFRPDPEGPPINIQRPTLNLSKGLAYLPQTNAVFDDLTVDDNLRLAGHTLRDRHDYTKRCDEVLASLPTLRPLLRRKPEKMSGGERQTVALAMVLLHQPKLLLLDEPFGGLDHSAMERMGRILADLHETQHVSLAVVEHRRWNLPELRCRAIQLRLGSVSTLGNTLVHPSLSQSTVNLL